MTFHLHTEDRPNLPALVIASGFPSFTLSPSSGYWLGGSEPSCTIEIETDDRAAILTLAHTIKTANTQAAVLIESYPSTSTLV